MGVRQINASFQNDGNSAQLAVRDIEGNGPLMRIETFRCSQPDGPFGENAAGTAVHVIAGSDHLVAASNRRFRHIFSAGQPERPIALLEIREEFAEDGSFEVRTRDIDARSESCGSVLVASAQPTARGVAVRYELRRPKTVHAALITSPVLSSVSQQLAVADLGEPLFALGSIEPLGQDRVFEGELLAGHNNASALAELDRFSAALREANPAWSGNVVLYERMGDFRDKCIHPGTNLTGQNARLASEFLLIRAYRMSLIALGRAFDPAMAAGAAALNMNTPLELDTKPGVYAVFLSAYALNIALYQLGLDKVHSDYGGVPMSVSPGSRLENASTPIVDATNLNRMLALLAAFYYVPEAVPMVTQTVPSITTFGVPEPMRVMERRSMMSIGA
jgi:hypothetical protein